MKVGRPTLIPFPPRPFHIDIFPIKIHPYHAKSKSLEPSPNSGGGHQVIKNKVHTFWKEFGDDISKWPSPSHFIMR
jgi:hypothetical protein